MDKKTTYEKRCKLIADAQALIPATGSMSKDVAEKFDRMMAEVDVLGADLDRIRKVEQLEAEQRSAGRPPRAQFAAANREEEEERSALTHFLLTGEKRDLLTTNNGQVLIPECMYGSIIQAQKSYGALTAALKQDHGPAGPLRLPYSADRTNLLTPAGEPAVTAEADPLLSSVESNTALYKTQWVKYTLQLLNRSEFNLDAFITGLFNKRFWRGLTEVVSVGGDQVQSIYASATVGATAAAANAVGYADLVALFSSLEEDFQANAKWVMSSTMRNSLIGVTDGMGRPLFIPSPNDGGRDRLLGKPIVINQYAPATAAGNRTILYGDLEESYLLRVPQSLTIFRSQEKFIDTAEIGLIGFAEIGGVATNPGDNRLMALPQKAS